MTWLKLLAAHAIGSISGGLIMLLVLDSTSVVVSVREMAQLCIATFVMCLLAVLLGGRRHTQEHS